MARVKKLQRKCITLLCDLNDYLKLIVTFEESNVVGWVIEKFQSLAHTKEFINFKKMLKLDLLSL